MSYKLHVVRDDLTFVLEVEADVSGGFRGGLNSPPEPPEVDMARMATVLSVEDEDGNEVPGPWAPEFDTHNLSNTEHSAALDSILAQHIDKLADLAERNAEREYERWAERGY